MPKEEKHKHKHKHHHKKHKRRSPSPSSSSSSDSEVRNLKQKFARDAAEERAAERNAERLDSDDDRDDREGAALEKELEEAGEVTEIVRSNGRREKVLKMQDGDGAFVVEDGHLSEGEVADLERTVYAPAARLDKKRRRREDADVQIVQQRQRERELAALREDRIIAERPSFAAAAAAASPEPPALDSFRERLRTRHPKRKEPPTELQRFLLWAEIPVIQALRPGAYERILKSEEKDLKRYVTAQTLFGKETKERVDRAKRAARSIEEDRAKPFERAFALILLPPNGCDVTTFRWDERKCTERSGLRCSFTGERIEEGAEYQDLLIGATHYVCRRYNLAARLDGLSKFVTMLKHVASTAKRRLAELAIPVDLDLPEKMHALFSDEQWLEEITAVYSFGTAFCDEVAVRYAAKV